MRSIERLFIANRGEIAVRVASACQRLGISPVVAVSAADRDSRAAAMADRVVCIGPAHPKGSYLNADFLVHAALATGCDALHPGYGFLSENPELAEKCENNNLIFVGPRAETIRLMGNKLHARAAAMAAELPLLPGTEAVSSIKEAQALAESVGYPVLLKAAAGGGGRGMKIANDPSSLEAAISLARTEAGAAFGDVTLYMERYLVNARHVEVQVLGDRAGRVIHLGERDCSLQRRHQKVVEEAPAHAVDEKVRADLHIAAVRLCEHVGYENAGTVEFIIDQDSSNYYFLEMNTRIQVEHPVTEMVTGIDLVAHQIGIAAGQPIGLEQEQVRIEGHAIEVRIMAESPETGFSPSPGRLTQWVLPAGEDIRVDTHCFANYVVPPFYDSLLAKLIVKGKDRHEAIVRLRQALDRFQVSGIQTTIPFLRNLAKEDEFSSSHVNTRWLEQTVQRMYGTL